MGAPDKFRLMVPDHGIGVIASPMSTVDGTPFENLPQDSIENGTGKEYTIELVGIED